MTLRAKVFEERVMRISTARLQEMRAALDAELARREQPVADLRDERARETVRVRGEDRNLDEFIDRRWL